MRKLLIFLVFPALLALPTTAAAGELKLTMNGGLVSLVADDVPLSAVLAEWARIGQTKIVNGEQIFTRVTLRIENTPERKALDILLRSAAGYMAAERATPVAGGSAFDRIMILPTSRAPMNSGPVMATPPPTFAPRPAQTPVPEVDDDPTMNPMPPGAGPQTMPMPPGMGVPPQPGQQQNVPLTAPRPGQLPAPGPQQPVPFGSPRPPGPGNGPGGGPGGVPPGGGPGGSGGGQL